MRLLVALLLKGSCLEAVVHVWRLVSSFHSGKAGQKLEALRNDSEIMCLHTRDSILSLC